MFVSGFRGPDWIYYSDRLIECPCDLRDCGCYRHPAQPERLSARDDKGNFSKLLGFGLKLSAFLIVPSTVGLALLRVPIVSLLFQRVILRLRIR